MGKPDTAAVWVGHPIARRAQDLGEGKRRTAVDEEMTPLPGTRYGRSGKALVGRA